MHELQLLTLFSSEDFKGLYQSVGMHVGAAHSSEDGSRLYGKVFHVPSNTGEAQAAMKKVTAQTHFSINHHHGSSFREHCYISVSGGQR